MPRFPVPVLPAAPSAARTPLPAGFRVALDSSTQLRSGGSVLLGGSPLRLVRLRPAATAMARGWLAGAPVGTARTEGLVARRLVRAGLVQPVPPPEGPGTEDVTVVVPVRDRPGPLAALLAALPGLAVVVVDDASADPAAIRAVAETGGATVLHLPARQGPGGARDAGLAAVHTPYVAFVDSDCLPQAGWLDRLLPHLADPLVAAVAPRVRPAPAGGRWPSAYEAVRSPLDRGDQAGLVQPGGRIPFVPTATLVVRRSAVGDQCFDPSLAGGEDVDLVWRLAEAGWDVRYEPAAVVHHARHDELGAWLARRAFYGTTAGPLARRHPDALAPASVNAWSAAAWGLAAGRRPLLAAATMGTSVGILAWRLTGVVEDPLAEATRIAGGGTLRSAATVQAGLARAWGPALAVACLRRRTRAVALVTLLAPALRDWRATGVGTPDRPALAGYVAAHVLDDLAYGAGVWWGCWRARTIRPLLPRIVVRSRTWSAAGLHQVVGIGDTAPQGSGTA